jgi:hypothetical protein
MRGDTGQQQRREGDARGDGGPARISFFTRERTRTSCSQRAGRLVLHARAYAHQLLAARRPAQHTCPLIGRPNGVELAGRQQPHQRARRDCLPDRTSPSSTR